MLRTWLLVVSALISRLETVFAESMFEDVYAEDAKALPPLAKTLSTIDTRSTLSPDDNGTYSGLRAWPRGGYRLALPDKFYLQISAARYTHPSPPLSRHLRGFIFEFADNIESEYPPPGLSPQRASQAYYDIDSFTKFRIQERVLGLLASRAPTAILIDALAKIAMQIRRHGPPESLNGLIYQTRSGLLPAKSFNLITLEILQFQSNGTATNSLDRSIDSSRASKENLNR